jgi:hypothetical protein
MDSRCPPEMRLPLMHGEIYVRHTDLIAEPGQPVPQRILCAPS